MPVHVHGGERRGISHYSAALGAGGVRYEPIVTSNSNRASVRTSFHTARIEEQRARARELEAKANRISLVRLVCFLTGVVTGFVGVSQGSYQFLGLSLLAFGAFFAAVVVHARVEANKREVEERRAVHERHLLRLAGRFMALPNDGAGLLPADHPYANDLDLVGPGSLFQRIDVTQTHEGARALANALGSPLDAARIPARQAAVEELVKLESFREELEVRARLGQTRGEKLNHEPFMALLNRPRLFEQKPWLKPTTYALLATTGTLLLLGALDVVPDRWAWLPILAQGFLLWKLKEPVHHALDLVSARIGFAQAYESMLKLIESQPWEASYLKELRASLDIDSVSPSTFMARLARYEGFAQLRTQGPVYIVLNLVTLWDLLCLERIERFAREVGSKAEHWFEVVGEFEMLCSLATLRDGDPDTTFPRIDPEHGVRAEGLAHPLLSPDTRVANDLTLEGPGSLLVVTGSNMAGKSTLLRALGLNVALALAGGPVCARSFTLCPVRLRASMRIDDSLQRGASYFHAELSKLRMVVKDLEQKPPVLFLLDELLRGTNARARNTGARSVILHLLSRSALGVVATHDIALSSLESELPHVHNVHFTDVFEDGEMRFDYKLRPGPVTTSNALRLLAMAGIDVPADDAVA